MIARPSMLVIACFSCSLLCSLAPAWASDKPSSKADSVIVSKSAKPASSNLQMEVPKVDSGKASDASSAVLNSSVDPAADTPPNGSSVSPASTEATSDSSSSPSNPGSTSLSNPGSAAPSNQSTKLTGSVEDSATMGGVDGGSLKSMIPQMDCVGFSARLGTGSALKGNIGNQNGYYTDGSTFQVMGDYPVASTIYPGSAADVGMQPGDILVEINGCSTYHLDENSVHNLFRSAPGVKNTYTARRGSQLLRFVTTESFHPFGEDGDQDSIWRNTIKQWGNFR